MINLLKNCFSLHFLLCLSISVSSNDIYLSKSNEVQGVFIEAIDHSCLSQPVDKEIFYDLANSNISITLNNRAFLKKMIRKQLDTNSFENIKKDNLDRSWDNYNKIIISLDDINCTFKGKYKLTGDLADHFSSYISDKQSNILGLSGAGPNFHSIKVKLSENSIDNIEVFKLFVPTSRSGEEEVIVTHLFSKLGFLAPRTAMLNISHDGVKRRLIFQEDITKGLFENSNVHENFLFEGDEKFGLGLTFSMPVIVNHKLISSSTKLSLAEKAYNMISKTYLKSGLLDPSLNEELDKDVFYPDPILTPDYFPTTSIDEITLFSMLSFATNTSEGLSKDDSRLIYDHISKTFRPIYYDGHADIYSPIVRKKVPFSFEERHKSELKKRLGKINQENFIDELRKLGVNASDKKIKSFLISLEYNIESLIPIKPPHIEIKDKLQNIMSSWESSNLYGGRKVMDNVNFLIFNDEKKLEDCHSDSLLDCEPALFDLDSIDVKKSLLTQKLTSLNKDFTETIFLGSLHSNSYINYPSMQFIAFDDFPNTTFSYSLGTTIGVDSENKKLYISQPLNKDQDNQVTISGGFLNGWSISTFQESGLGYTFNENDRLSNNHLTGCITFSDIKLDNVDIDVGTTHCEDAVHFVRVTGKNISLSINGAKSDALDADFSDIHFSSIIVNKAGNDCIDMSAGSYIIDYSELINCGDKGISGGERSSILIKSLSVDSALYGIVSKDSSVVNIDKSLIKKSPVCFAAYRKKKEFLGGSMNIKNYECISEIIGPNAYEQKGSFINIIQNK